MRFINHQYKIPVLRLIQKHQGKDHPIQVSDIMDSIPLSDREIRRIVQYLINNMGYAIGSTTKNPFGFFMIVKIEDYLEAISNLESRKRKIQERIDAIRKACLDSGLEIPTPAVEIKGTPQQTIFNISNSIFINFK